MEKNKTVEPEVIDEILRRYGFEEAITEQKAYIHYIGENGFLKLIFRVTLESGRMLVIKLVLEDEGLEKELQKFERQSAFSEFMRASGIPTPARHRAGERFCTEYEYRGIMCSVTVEDWCGEEIAEITADTARKIGELMARMHTLSLDGGCAIGCGTLFSAAYWNDVDAFPLFCKLCEDEHLDKAAAEKIKVLHDRKLEHIRSMWESLPKAAVQGDISINNLSWNGDALVVFDYNNAGDEVLVSDLVMEGLLTAYEMDLPEGVDADSRKQLFPAFLEGYLSVRPLTAEECEAAWDIYTMYNGLWFTRVQYNENSLEKLLERGEYDAANQLLDRMLADISEEDDGRFGGA